MASMKTVMVILMTIFFGLLSNSQLSLAEIFKWVDEKGTVHFTQDPATIPEKYRDKVKIRMTEEDLMTPEEKIRAKKQYEEELRERLKREKKEYDAKEFQRKVKEMEERQKRKMVEGKCEIVSYSQYDVNMGGGIVSGIANPGGSVVGVVVGEDKETCVYIVIRNNDREPKTITQRNIVATTSRPIETKTKFNPKAVFIQIGQGETYRGSICFDRELPIAKLELQGL